MKRILALTLTICLAVSVLPVFATDEPEYVYDTKILMETVSVDDGINAYLRLPGYIGKLNETLETTEGTTNSDIYVVYTEDDDWDGNAYYAALNIRMNSSKYYFNGVNDVLAWKCFYDAKFRPVSGGNVVFSDNAAQLNFTKGPGLYLGLGVIPYSDTDTGFFNYNEAMVDASAASKIKMAALGYSFILVLNDESIEHLFNKGTLDDSSTFTWPGLTELIEAIRVEKIAPAKDANLANFKNKNIYLKGQFTDIDRESTQWYVPYVKSVFELGFMQGNADGSFGVQKSITIAECLAIAARMHNIYYGGAGTFTQAQGADWYKVYQFYCTENGIIKSNDFLNVNRAATRAEMSYIFCNAVDDGALEEIIPDASFNDVTAATGYDTEIMKLAMAGIVQGDSRGFRPTDNITRAEAAAIIARIANKNIRIKQ